MTSARQAVAAGRRAEEMARRYLKERGMVLEAGNVRGGGGELDVVALDGEVLVFVEVKSGAGPGDPRQRVDHRKRRRLVAAAEAYLAQRPGPTPRCRFDVVTVRLGERSPRIEHLPDAFRVGD